MALTPFIHRKNGSTNPMRITTKAAFFLAVLAVSAAGVAQHGGGHGHHTGHGAQMPYAGMQERGIKALSEQQIADLRQGKGMSLALPAELNGYPGPAHVLKLADQLELTAAQRTTTQKLFDEMQQKAKVRGEDVISAERELDVLFKEKRATPEILKVAIGKAADAQGRLREAHLQYHLAMTEVLSPEQIARYGKLRGY
ncbi:MAG TPA: Spy/CpxP family protein refolding chaperone [Burkholderiaceae bacterium]|nr:Spy/CpxP family protein refolding chaperone [Burkholderiaceae bacterium]